MATKIYHPISPESRDQTGLKLCGRHEDGRYQYRSRPVVGYAHNVMSLTHAERVGLALCRGLAKQMLPGSSTSIYPMTRESGAGGYGTYSSSELWIKRPALGSLGKSYLAGEVATHRTGCLSILCHEMGHNTQRGGTPHGPEFRDAQTKMHVACKKALSKGWPKIDMRRLRDSVAPHIAKRASKAKSRAKAASEGRVVRWARTVASAEQLLAVWNKKLTSAERKVAAWEKKVRHAQACLDRATREEAGSAS